MMETCNVVQTFEIFFFAWYHLFSLFHKMKFWTFLEFWCLALLGVSKGLNGAGFDHSVVIISWDIYFFIMENSSVKLLPFSSCFLNIYYFIFVSEIDIICCEMFLVETTNSYDSRFSRPARSVLGWPKCFFF